MNTGLHQHGKWVHCGNDVAYSLANDVAPANMNGIRWHWLHCQAPSSGTEARSGLFPHVRRLPTSGPVTGSPTSRPTLQLLNVRVGIFNCVLGDRTQWQHKPL